MRTTVRAALAFMCIIACQTPAPSPLEGRIVDLTHAFDADTIFWPTELDGFVLEPVAAGVTEQGYYYAANRFRTAEHGGTHIDAPLHFAKGRESVDEIPLGRLIGHGIVIDVSLACSTDADYQVSVADLTSWEAMYGRIPEQAIVLLHTGYSQHWGDRARYLGTARRGPEAVAELHFPGLHPTTARWLVQRREIASIGIDTASIDHGQSQLFESHRILFEQSIPAFENLAHLGRLPPTGFTVVALPMKIRGGSGGPLRAVAILPWRSGDYNPGRRKTEP